MTWKRALCVSASLRYHINQDSVRCCESSPLSPNPSAQAAANGEGEVGRVGEGRFPPDETHRCLPRVRFSATSGDEADTAMKWWVAALPSPTLPPTVLGSRRTKEPAITAKS